MNVFVARQPVFDKNRNVFAYELLFRNGLKNEFPDIDGDVATSNVLSNSFFCFGFNELLGNKPGMVNFTKDLILKRVPLLFTQNQIVVEVLEEMEPEKEIIDALSEFRQKGLKIALDDFVYHERFHPMIDNCGIIKFDLLSTPLDSLPEIINKIKSKWNVTFLAEKVETYDEFEQAKKLGFDLFQGYFFSKPEVISKKAIAPNILAKLKLINELHKTNINLEKVEDLIKHDVSLSLRLLNFLNSAYFKRQNPINTIKDALTFLGVEELKKFLSVIIISNLSESKPNELVRKSLCCARICEQCGSIIRTKFSNEELFTMGLFSYLDAILDQHIDNILKNIHLAEPLKNALKGKDKEFNIIMDIYHAFEKGDWENKFFKIAGDTKIVSYLPQFYFDSIKMANTLFNNHDGL